LKLRAWYFIIYKDAQPVGLLPLVGSNKKIYSLPHLSYGGVHPNGETIVDEVVYYELCLWIAKSDPIAGFYKLELPEKGKIPDCRIPLFVRSTTPLFNKIHPPKSTYWLNLSAQTDQQMHLFNPNLRRKIRSSARKGVVVSIGGVELLESFMLVYQQNLHHLGSPSLGKSFLHAMISFLKAEDSRIAIARLGNKIIGGGIWFLYQGFCENNTFATLRSHNAYYTSYALHWSMIQYAINNKFKIYSFGRSSTNSSVEHYKKQWPVNTIPIFYNHTHPSKSISSHRNFFSKIWKHLPPFLVNTLGPPIAKRIF
jgi:hypothetical protein